MVVRSCRESDSRIQGIGRENGEMGVGLKWGSGGVRGRRDLETTKDA